MYTVIWERFEHGKETDGTICNSREFSTYEKAKAFLLARFLIIKSTYWAGGRVEDVNGKWLIDITYTGEIEETV